MKRVLKEGGIFVKASDRFLPDFKPILVKLQILPFNKKHTDFYFDFENDRFLDLEVLIIPIPISWHRSEQALAKYFRKKVAFE